MWNRFYRSSVHFNDEFDKCWEGLDRVWGSYGMMFPVSLGQMSISSIDGGRKVEVALPGIPPGSIEVYTEDSSRVRIKREPNKGKDGALKVDLSFRLLKDEKVKSCTAVDGILTIITSIATKEPKIVKHTIGY